MPGKIPVVKRLSKYYWFCEK